MDERSQELLAFFKALSDANRLKIIGLLARQGYTVEELAAMLELRPSTISHHLSRLSKVGLVSARAEGYYNIYRLETNALEAKARRLLAQETLSGISADVDLDAYDRKVLANYTRPDGRLKALPSQRKKLEVILRYVLGAFEADRRYSEKEVNGLLAGYHEDTASLRRDLIDLRMLDRNPDGSEYWRLP